MKITKDEAVQFCPGDVVVLASDFEALASKLAAIEKCVKANAEDMAPGTYDELMALLNSKDVTNAS